MKLSKKKELVQKRRWRIRKKISGTSERPRIAVRFTNKNIHAQCIDDIKGIPLLHCPQHTPITRMFCPIWMAQKN